MKKLEGKTIWITGASSGIGESLALLCSKKAAGVIISSRDKKALEAVKLKCGEHADRVFIQTLDLSDPQSIKIAFQKVQDEFESVDYLFLNGGLSQRSLLAETSLEVDRKIMEVNFFGNVTLAKVILPFFIKQGHGHFVVTSSLAGVFGFPLRSSYSAAKHALHGYFDTLRAEQDVNNIRVTIACPGRISSNISLNALGPDGRPTGIMDEAQINGMPSEQCAAEMIRAALRNKKEVYIGRKEVLMVYFKRYLPFIYYKLVTKVKPN